MLKLKDLKGTFAAICKADMQELCGFPAIAENADKIAQALEANLKAQGCNDFKREGNNCYFGNQFLMLPKIRGLRSGFITFRSKDFVFKYEGVESHGALPKAKDLTADGFIITLPNGTLTYKIKSVD